MADISEAEKRTYSKVFELFDLNGNGSLSRSELSKYCKRLGFSITKTEMKDLFGFIDADNSGSISLEEFLKIVPNLPRYQRRCAELRRLFTELDVNNDGYVSPDELPRVISTSGISLSAEEVQSLRVEAERDGRLDYQKFSTLVEALEQKKSEKS